MIVYYAGWDGVGKHAHSKVMDLIHYLPPTLLSFANVGSRQKWVFEEVWCDLVLQRVAEPRQRNDT